ncbi:methylmalonyl Co-A mutase-associated GTPase MeaB [Leptospira biflexa]|uniref:methylmalonyl Co-A mutase-associated GTPase MeaB n=1 Tax=Leptospira biflexa TaxID=172 RepID=UPI001091804F|nr:methylmalonyl Co-A mutase-associated GTPase MeaB [Leptospira biflexa]TGM42731.1 methylmalonyl Co-A mutase-associated GTPase MeaB [Leptospira biflexa]TGM45809.1 methylmalonyl Co-A mutase-associated GTPase MeaB [Leptospira biflexa]
MEPPNMEDQTEKDQGKRTETKSALSVNPGVADAPAISPYIRDQRKSLSKKEVPAESLAEGILSGNRTALSKAITLVESNLEAHNDKAQAILELVMPKVGNSIRIGITGVPGVGKSTFIESFGSFILEQNRKLAVLAIDPSSQRTRGSILGDKTRMEILSKSENAFIRPSPSSGSLGGVARKTRESMYLCEAAGFDTIIIETVGVGQSETQVHSMVDFFLLLMLAGAGDELQGIKRGIMEMADLIAINKADGPNEAYATRARAEYESALHLFPAPESKWTPRATTCSGLGGKGIDEIWNLVLDYITTTNTNGYYAKNREDQTKTWFEETLREAVLEQFFSTEGKMEAIQNSESKLMSGKSTLLKEIKSLLGK